MNVDKVAEGPVNPVLCPAYDESTELAVRAINNQHGGGAHRDAVVAQVRWAQHLLTAVYSDHVGSRLHLALADLHNLAGRTSLDPGLYPAARRHSTRALAKHADDASPVAKVRYCVGQLHLRRGFHRDALKFFRLRQQAAQDSGSEPTVATLCANEAWAYAYMREADQALKSIDREQDGFARAARDNEPVWVRLLRPRRSPRHDGHGLCFAARSRSLRPRSRPSRQRR